MAFDTTKLKELAISETGLLFDPSTGYMFTSNAVGVLILTALRDNEDVEEIRELILKEHEADGDTVEKDMFDFLNQLASFGLIKEK